MLIIDNKNRDPYLNHAIEEHLINSIDDDCFMLWQNAPCVLIGRNQNVYAEINMDYIRENNIKVVRRITGGGTVFNDNGNFNFTFIAKKSNSKFADFMTFTKPIVSALREMGVMAEFKGRNDLVIDDKKFSGNAQCIYKDKVLHHGTLLFSSDMHALTSALNVNNLKLECKNIKSSRNRVTNISEHLKEPMTLDEFKNKILEYVLNNVHNGKYYQLSKQDIEIANEIATNKYRLTSWNFPQKIDFTITKEKKYNSGLLQLQTNVDKGIIKQIKFYGDFFGVKEIEKIEESLIDIRYNKDDIMNVLSTFDIDKYIKGITSKDILSLII